jgi:hypothetical protein
MGKRVHTLTKRIVEYSDYEGFNWKYNEFQQLLETLGCSTCPDSSEFPDDFEVDVKQYENALNVLKTNKDKLLTDTYQIEINESTEASSDEIVEAINDCFDSELTEEKRIQSVIEDMEAFFEKADKHDGYIYFSAF